MKLGLCCLGIVLLLAVPRPSDAQTAAELRPTAHAIKDAKVVTEPGKVLDKATVVIRDGFIVAVGPDVAIPPDALVTDGKGITVYAGFLDAGSARGFDAALRRSQTGAPAVEDMAADPLAATKADHRKGLTPEFAVQTALKLDEETIAPWRRVGFTAHLATPSGGYFSGTSAVVSLSDLVPRDALLRAPVALHVRFDRVQEQGYPSALMGIIAHCRQTMLDAGWLKRQWATFEANGRVGKRPASDPGLEALWPALEGKIPVAFEADTADQIHRALDFAAEFKLKPMIVGGRYAYKVIDRLKAENVPVILRLDFTTPGDREADLLVRVREDRERLRQLEVACPAALNKAGIKFAFTTQNLQAPRFRENLKKVIAAGLPADVALAALTTNAAEMLGVAPQVGQVTKSRAANLLLCDGSFDATATKYKYAFADGIRFDLDERAAPPTGAAAAAAAPAGPGRGGRGQRGQNANPNNPATPTVPGAPVAQAPGTTPPVGGFGGGRGGFGGGGGRGGANANVPFSGNGFRALISMLDGAELSVTETEADRIPKTKTGGDVLVRNATVITGTGKTLEKTDILVKGGKIKAIGTALPDEKGVTEIDATGLFVMPGIIDTHCHFAISGGVNEGSLSVVPEVRIRDVVDSEDVQIYRALGGGVTTSRLLHGSADVIGGQDAVVKLKFGRPAKEMLVTDGPRGVKFALGENVKRTDGRFPNSRLGVEAVLVRAFTEARTYKKKWEDYEKAKGTPDALPEPRRDLRLEALAAVLSGDIRIHSHCYRSDEILMLLRVADRFGVKVKSLQHVLEGYKVAPEIAAHGASVSIFSDWWAYKIEAFDAIPYAARLLKDAGVSVCLKSDDNELMRHLNQEAAKLVKYCGFTPDEAIQTITLNPARQLGLESKVGTIEVGKDGDLAIFTGHPLNSYARCEMTLVEGEVYFQQAEKMVAVAAATAGPGPQTKPFTAIPEAGTYILKGGTVHQPGKPAFAGSVVVTGRKITMVIPAGDSKQTPPADAKVVDVSGLHLYPGMIDAGTSPGPYRNRLIAPPETNDSRDGGDFQPDLKAIIGVNPDSELLPVNTVRTASPQSSPGPPGRSCVGP